MSDTIESLGLLNRGEDPALDAIVRLAGVISGGSASGIHIFDEQTQHRIAGHNAPVAPHPREDSMCRLVVESGERIATADASEEERFRYTSFTQGDEPGVRMYVSTPLPLGGDVVGTLCAWDSGAATLSDEQLAAFDDLALVAARVLTARESEASRTSVS